MNEVMNLSDKQLLSILLGNENLSEELLNTFSNNFADMARDLLLTNIKGLGKARLNTLSAAFELGRRKAKQDEINRLNAQIINNSRTIFAQFNQELSDLDHEELWGIYLSKNGKILKKVRISSGGVDQTGADIRMIVKPAVDLNASNVCLCHNHPHSTTRPSKDDKDMTQKAKEALALFDIRLLDHIIISDGRYYSFADNGDMR